MSNCYKKDGWIMIEVQSNCHYPQYYGRAYYDYMRNVSICYPIGINWLVYLFREIVYIIKNPPLDKETMAYKKGHSDGYFKGWEEGLKK